MRVVFAQVMASGAEETGLSASTVIELSVVFSTLGLVIVTALLTWVSWKQFKKDSDNIKDVANNSIDSMENVAVHSITEITESNRQRQLHTLKRIRKHPLV